MRSPRQWYRDELGSKDGMNIALGILIAVNGMIEEAQGNETAAAIFFVAALAILRGKL